MGRWCLTSFQIQWFVSVGDTWGNRVKSDSMKIFEGKSPKTLGLPVAAVLLCVGIGSYTAQAQQCDGWTCAGGGNAGWISFPAQEWAVQQQAMLDQQNAQAALHGAPRAVPHVAIAFHPDASDIWVAAMYPSKEAARDRAMLQCYEVMGNGCEWTWQAGNGFIGAARSPDGQVIWATDGSKKAVQKRLDEWCKYSVLGCTPIGMFNAKSEFRPRPYRGENIRPPKDIANVRKVYGAVSWLAEAGYNGKSWIASGYNTAKEAEDVALNACRLRSNSNINCELAVTTGNGVLISYNTGKAHRVLAEQDEARARQAVAQFCKHEKLSCTIHHIYDVRQPGVFENVMN